ncbi:ABC transporter substrate-binding protein [Ramlibacter sp. AN1133]|uniref:ABC transporter substrate-binding protein n=1 Tax=Ramlibacter sp. AN1133 TaxID=3133429 RepID=UPI0030C12746
MGNRRDFLQTTAAAGLTIALPGLARAQAAGDTLRIGLMAVKSGPLASGGIDMERALNIYLAERDQMMAGRKVQVFFVDAGAKADVARAKVAELCEVQKIHALLGPQTAIELLALDEVTRSHKLPLVSTAAAEDVTQRKANPWLVRPTASSAQTAHVMADYCAKTLKYKRMALVADDFPYGHETAAGFQRVFEESGGKIVQRIYTPLVTPDYSGAVGQLAKVDGVFLAFAGSNGFRFIRQFADAGLRDKLPLVGSMTSLDESVLRNMGDEALGIHTASWYSADLATPANARFVPDFRKAHGYDPGFYAAAMYISAEVLESALKTVGGKASDPQALMAALRKSHTQTLRGPVRFDEYGNAVGDVLIRKVERKDGRLVNAVVKTYPNVSQFWTHNARQFLANPVYSRDWPPARNIEG